MRKDTQAKVITALLAAGLVVYVVGEKYDWQAPSGEGFSLFRLVSARSGGGSSGGSLIGGEARESKNPRDTIYAMLDAARDGDVEAYIACHAGEMARQLAQSRDEMTPQGFAKYLADRNREIKGIAINEPEMASPDEARIRVEYVYRERNEAQQVYLERVDGAWKITAVDATERVETLVPYGTPVY